MAFDLAMGVQEAAVSSETVLSCLTLLNTRFDAQVDIENVRSRQQSRGATLSISELIELANDFGLRAKYIRCEWPWLQLAVATQPILLLLRNGNAIVSVGTGRTGAEELVVCDPLHRGGIPIILSRENIERAWDGNAIAIEPNPFTYERLTPNRDVVVPEVLRQANPEPRRAETRVTTAPQPPRIPTVLEVCTMFADKLTPDERKQLALLIEKMLDSRHRDADQASDLPAVADHPMLLGRRETTAELHRPESQHVDSRTIIGLVIAFLLLALAGHASWGVPGLAVGLLIGIVLVFSVMKLVLTPMINSRAFDPLPSNHVED
jgi:hypothetical protein